MRRRTLLQTMCVSLADPGLARAAVRAPEAPSFGAVWEAFKAAHMRAGQVTDSFTGITHSEGQGYALLFAAWAGDASTFKQAWEFTRKLQRPDGLFSWRWEDGKVVDANNATDGDIYIAWALLEAAQRFGATYKQEALRVLEGMRLLRAATKHGEVLLPGLQGFVDPGTSVARVNLSYWVLPAFEAFRQVHDAEFWTRLTATGLRLMSYSVFGHYQLPPDWLLLTDPVTAFGAPARFGYDAIRVPLFLAWSNQLDHPAIARFKAFAATSDFPAAVTLTDVPKVEKAPVFELVRQVVDRKGHEKVLAAGTALPSDYYGKALMLLSMRALAS